ncbi:hypothetical protein IMZ31_24375 (plasmid) [Pontibacillus sp. ALD_SL1]|uniref:hypothetical protein n=1 Tax=Pontibacillus sp. ALD_SL1 TaxID=2777185 RepID=UPI001A957F98|nr:hypothetical protein [Pontibacillus sp. ALD_SL1]QST02590.1 hypothetical protein IMZ31_24375 [Pontibacillus sp. ALD_SL1]
MYVSHEHQNELAEDLLRLFLDEREGYEVIFAKTISGLYEKYDEFQGDAIVRLFKAKLKEQLKNEI